MKYNIVNNGDSANITVVIGRDLYQADNTHENWTAICAGVLADDPNVVNLFDVGRAITTKFQKITDRVSVKGDNVYLDNEIVNNELTQQILRFLRNDEDFAPLVNFYEKISTNPNEHSRTQLYSWLKTHDFAITKDGDIVGYKGVKRDDEFGFRSQGTGHAISNGVEYQYDSIPNSLGAIVEMPRNEVAHDPRASCSTGLHVGTWRYAKDFARDAVLTVIVNPRDVVSVPTDCNGEKMRVCRYTVHAVADEYYSQPVFDVTKAVLT